MRLTFLGTGTSAGVPAIGCDCRVCTSTDPRDNRLRTSAAVSWTDASGQPRVVLIDAGPDLRQQVLRAKIARCDAILFTHNHADHTFGLDEVRRFNVLQQTAIPIYAEAHTLEHLGRVYTYIFQKDKNVNDSFVAHLLAHQIPERDVMEGRALELFGVRFTPIRAHHGRLPVLGFRIETSEALARAMSARGEENAAFPLAYLTDVSAIPPESYRRLTGLKTLVLDALRHRVHPTHLSIDQALNIALNVEAAKTYFVHMAHEVMHEEVEADLPENVHLAYDGLMI
jgi:phosphoribosyl 1,2-cyclic phosphate phosphodiesterase